MIEPDQLQGPRFPDRTPAPGPALWGVCLVFAAVVVFAAWAAGIL